MSALNTRSALLLTSLLVNAFIIVRVTQVREVATIAQAQHAEGRDSIVHLFTERKILLSHLSLLWASQVGVERGLTGLDVVTGNPIELSANEIDVVYVFSTTCPGSVANLQYLEQLAASGKRVVAISDGDPQGALDGFAKEHAITFPVVARASGPLFHALRKGPTPVTVALRGGAFAELYVGSLSRVDRTSELWQ